VLVVGAMGIAACGGDDDTTNTSATATSQASSAAGTSTEAAGDPTSAATDEPTSAPVDATDPPDGDGAADACALLTKAEVEAALGETVNEPTSDPIINAPISGGVIANISTCGFTSESFTSSISITYYSAPGEDEAIQSMIQLACSMGNDSIDLGDQACWYDDQHVQIQLAKGDAFLDIFATTSLNAGDILMTLAAKAAARM
jgi:hypothetical protein